MGRVLEQVEAWLAEQGESYRYSEDQPRDDHGRFGEGGDDDSEGDVDEGDYGYGRDSNGVSYTEFDVNQETGEPKFSEPYREKYGPVIADDQIGDSPYALVDTDNGSIHIADDSNGTMDREVIQEFTPSQAKELGDGVYAVYSGEKESFTSTTGVSVQPASANPTRDGVDVTFAGGQQVSLDGEAGNDAAFSFQESLNISGGG
jgi:hypothetical protein